MISDRENKKRLFSENRSKFNGEYDEDSYKWEVIYCSCQKYCKMRRLWLCSVGYS